MLNSKVLSEQIPPSTGRLCTRLTPTMKNRKETSFTRGSKLCSKPEAADVLRGNNRFQHAAETGIL